MSLPESDDVASALRDFVARIDVLDPDAPSSGDLEVRFGGQRLSCALRTPVARALVAALRQYQDPRDRGRCDHCGGGRLDDNFLCLDCGQPNGLFGRMVVERAAAYTESAAIGPRTETGGRHARDED
jgi:hypothetical protein